MKSKIIWKLTACFAVVLLLFTSVLGTVFVVMFRQHTISIHRSAMEEKAVLIAQTLSEFESGQVEAIGAGKQAEPQNKGKSKSQNDSGKKKGKKSGSTTVNGQENGYVQGNGNGQGNGYGAYLRFLDELAMAEVWIVDENLNMLSTGHEHAMTSPKELPENAREMVDRVFQGEITYGEELSDIMKNPTLTVGAPIRTESGILGAVLVHAPVSGVDKALEQGMSALGGGVIIALLFAGIVSVLLSYGFTSPLRRMKITAFSLAEGDYKARTGVTQKDEIGELAQTIDLLSDHLLAAKEERDELDQLKQDFVANVSHELRTPVAVLRGSLELLKDGTVDDSNEIKEYYHQMLDESRHLERLVNDLLDLSRLQDDRFPLDIDTINLCDIIRDTARAIRVKAQENQIQIEVLCPEEICMVRGDYGRIRQMVLILLDNAVKFSGDGKRVELELIKQNNRCCIMITDYGTGISLEELPYIFDRFRKNRSSQNKTGTGLGLPIARQIAERHHAEIGVESGTEGTRFDILFEEHKC